MISGIPWNQYAKDEEPTQRECIIGVLPGGGWMIRWVDNDDEPVLGWLVNEVGEAFPLHVQDGEGLASATDNSNNGRLWHPGIPRTIPAELKEGIK